jgi:hypothetical protein
MGNEKRWNAERAFFHSENRAARLSAFADV